MMRQRLLYCSRHATSNFSLNNTKLVLLPKVNIITSSFVLIFSPLLVVMVYIGDPVVLVLFRGRVLLLISLLFFFNFDS